jgi:molybdopterin/thiamine biosynthesis adenylyltransferase
MSGAEELILIDSDTVEVSNLNRLPLEESFVGKKKVTAVKEFVSEIRKIVRIETHDLRIKKPEDCQILRGAVFCCTDNLKSQQLVCAHCKKNGLPYQRIGYDGTILNVSKTFPLTFEEIKDEDGYTVTPSWVIPAVLAAAAGVASRAYKEICLMDDLGKLHVRNSSHVPEKILDEARQEREDEIIDNIHEYVPDSYGCCEDCNRVDPDNSDYGYCPDCEEHYSEEEIEDIKEKAKQEGVDEIISQLESGNVEDADLRKALKSWKGKEV